MEQNVMDFHDQVLSYFIEESTELLRELKSLGDSLNKVGVPNEEESEGLSEFAQKLNRLIGGTASMGFENFAPLSRKTSLLAAKCAEVREMTIRVLISNLNDVISILSECFTNLDTLKEVEQKIPQIEERIDICMTAAGIEHSDIQDQNQIDDILTNFTEKESGSKAKRYKEKDLGSAMNFHDDVLSHFIAESTELIGELQSLGESLKKVGVPNEKESERLSEFAQKLNRLIGGTAAMGFEKFAPLSRKTSLLAAKCAEIREMTIRVLISNLNDVVSVLSACFNNLDTVKEVEQKIPQVEERIDICMTAVGIEKPDIQTQEQIDDIIDKLK
jgi:hypothetical protein